MDRVALTFIFNELVIVTYNEERTLNVLGLCLRKELRKGLGQSKAIHSQKGFFNYYLQSVCGEEDTGILPY